MKDPKGRDLLANADAIVFDDPKLAFCRSFRQCGHKALQESNQRRFVLRLGAEDDDAGKQLWWVGLDISKVQIQSQQDAALSSTPRDDNPIVRSREVLVADRLSLEPH